ncbi:hypothetical protein K439DRAFT_1355619 [Ramaria rubella]|nr:hypothetical protein K439DRAFT_1355619 [Ramaria rubella]
MATDTNECRTLTDVTVFQIWKIRITAELRDKKVWGVVDGSEVNPGPSVTIYPSYYHGTDTWEIRDGKAHSIMVKYMSNSLIFKHIASPQTAKELWASVMSQFKDQNTGVSAFYTYIEMMNLKWDGTSDINTHVSKMHAAEKNLQV